jgi:hypothetical protein
MTAEAERRAATFVSCEYAEDRMVVTLSDGLLFINCDGPADNAGVFLRADEAARLARRIADLLPSLA